MKKIIIPLIISLLFTGCATTKVSPDLRNKLNQTQADIKTTPISILVNPCLLTNELGRDLVLKEQSQLTAEKFIQTFKQQLNEQGVQVNEATAPFICGSMSEEQLKKFDIKADQNAKRSAITTFPILNSKSSSMTSEQQNAVLALNQYILKSNEVELANARNKKVTLPKPELSQTTVTSLKDWSKSNYIFITSLDGLDASMGSKFAMGTLSLGVTLATMGAGAGFVTAYMPKEGQFYTVSLFDLDKQQFVWTKHANLNGKIYSIKNHSLEAKNILDPLFEAKKPTTE